MYQTESISGEKVEAKCYFKIQVKNKNKKAPNHVIEFGTTHNKYFELLFSALKYTWLWYVFIMQLIELNIFLYLKYYWVDPLIQWVIENP